MNPQDDVFERVQEVAHLALANMAPKDFLDVEFYYDAIQDTEKTREAGRPIFRDVECIQIRTPGERDVIRRQVTDADRLRFAAKYALFQDKADQSTTDGYPLKLWPLVTEAQRRELAHFGVRSVEQLANLADTAASQLGPFVTLRQQARDYLAAAKEAAVVVKLRTENDELRLRIQELERVMRLQAQEIQAARNGQPIQASPPPPDGRLAALEAQLAAITDALKAPKRGRPVGSKNKPKAPPQAPPEG